MSASSRFDLSSSSPDRPLCASGLRGSYGSTSLDRPGSFRENMENPILSTLPNMTRSTSTATQTDVINFFQCLRFDPKAMVTEHKLNRHIDFKRLTSLAVGMPVEVSPVVSSKGKLSSSPYLEDARRLKASLRESCTKARERVKIFTESLSVINKWFPTIPSRKRSRSDALSNERSSVFFPSDRLVSGTTSIGKMGVQSGYELEQQKFEERIKRAVPNKRTRTSMVDLKPEVRASTLSKPSGNSDRDREALRPPNGSTFQGEERTSSIAVEGWEKSKMKKKRSVIKPDSTGSSMTSKPNGNHREPKQGLPSRPIADSRLRFGDADTHGFSTKKAAPRETFTSNSPNSSLKMNSAARAPRSVSGVAPKLSPVIQNASASNDWEISHCTSKFPPAVGAGNRKRTPSMRSSSPPVGQWASQRPQKISRSARRINFPVISNNDDIPSLDSTSDVLSNERRLSGSSPKQGKLKGDHFSSAASESEESGAAEIKSIDRSNGPDELDETTAPHVQKMSLLPPPRKNKRGNREGHGDGIRRKGRTGRGFTSTRTLMPIAERHGNVGTAKQLRSSRQSFDKTESKAGRPPTRKLADRKAYKRHKHSTISSAADLLVGSDDGHEELLAAANAATKTAQALSSSFWKQMEPFFRFISEIDTTFLTQQVNNERNLAVPVSVPFDADHSIISDDFGLYEFGEYGNETESLESTLDHINSGQSKSKGISLYQRVMAALIPEDLYCSGSEDLNSNSYRSGFEMEMDSDSNISCAEVDYGSETSKYPASNGYLINASEGPFDHLEKVTADNDIFPTSDMGDFLNYDHSQKCQLPRRQTIPGLVCSEYQYGEMSIDEKLLLEIHCIGIYPELEADLAETGNEEISADISRLDEKHHEMAAKKKGMLGKLLTSAADSRDFQEKEFEQRALDKLVEMAYVKYMSCWGPTAHGTKSASGKMAKQVALTLVKRTLDRCQEFEETGKSCFCEQLFKDMFLTAISRLSDGQTDSNTDGEATKSYFSTSGCSGEARASALGPQQSPSFNQDTVYEANLSSEASRVKRRELEDVIGASSGGFSGVGCQLSSSTKGKRSERDREGKGNNREPLSRNGSIKLGRPAASSVKGERKPKTKSKQKVTQLSTSANGLLGKMSEQPNTPGSSLLKSSDVSASGTGKDTNDFGLDELEDPIDLSGLQLPGMDVLGVPDDFDGQGQDIGSWLNIDDDGLQDHDFMGLEIPMDDLSDLNMMA